ncbi:hypothetical protein ACVWXB_006600 [Streptomyces sp. TE12347]
MAGVARVLLDEVEKDAPEVGAFAAWSASGVSSAAERWSR